MKKKSAILMAAVMGMIAMGGCGDVRQSVPEDGEVESIRLMVWAPSEDQSKDSGEWLQTCCEAFAEEHPEYDIHFVYGVADEATAASTVSQDPDASADVFMYANDNLTVLTDAKAVAKLGGIYEKQVMEMNSQAITDSLRQDDSLYGIPFTTNTWYMFYDKSVFSEEDVKSLDAMLDKGVVSFPLTNSWYLPAFYVGNGCTLFEDGNGGGGRCGFCRGEGGGGHGLPGGSGRQSEFCRGCGRIGDCRSARREYQCHVYGFLGRGWD